ncbi:MAG: VTT domain-containing protein [Deinococcota bacterium]
MPATRSSQDAATPASTDTNSTAFDTTLGPKIPNSLKLVALLFWAGLIAAFWIYALQQEVSPVVQLANLIGALQTGWLGPLILFMVYLLRPFVQLPVTLLTLLCGFLYGAVGGYLFTTVAILASSLVIYALGMLASTSAHQLSERSLVKRLLANSFETVLTARLLFVPGDIINYMCGLLRVNVRPFLVASLIGGAPGALMVVLVGASIEGDFEARSISLRPAYLVGSLLLLITSLGLSQWLRKRRGFEPDDVQPTQDSA